MRKIKKKLRKLMPNILVLIATVLIFLLVLEGVLQLIHYKNLNSVEPDEYLLYRRIPNKKVTVSKSEFSNIFILNSRGMNDYERNYSNLQNKTRILVIGDSFVESFHVPFEESFTRKLEKKLNQEAGPFEVISAAVAGYSTENQLKYYEIEGREYGAEIVILAFFANDIYDNLIRGIYSVEDNKLKDLTPLKINYLKKVFLKCSRYSQICALLYETVLKNKDIFNFLQILRISNIKKIDDPVEMTFNSIPKDLFLENKSKRIVKGIEKTRLLINELDSMVKDDNATLVIFSIPKAEQVDSGKKTAFINKYFEKNEKIDILGPQKIIADISGSAGIIFFDPIEEFIKRNENNSFYYDINGHWNIEGHTLVAELLFSFMNENFIEKNAKE